MPPTILPILFGMMKSCHLPHLTIIGLLEYLPDQQTTSFQCLPRSTNYGRLVYLLTGTHLALKHNCGKEIQGTCLS